MLLEKLIFNVIPKNEAKTYNCEHQNHGLEKVLDQKLIIDCVTSIEKKNKVNLNSFPMEVSLWQLCCLRVRRTHWEQLP